MNMDEEFTDLLQTAVVVSRDCSRVRGYSCLEEILIAKTTPEMRKQLALLLAENIRFDVPDFDQDLKDETDRLRVWGKILGSPIEELPTLLGTREDLNELIGQRMKA